MNTAAWRGYRARGAVRRTGTDPSVRRTIAGMVTAGDVRRIALTLPRTEEALVRDQIKFRVGRIVYLAISPDETSMGFAFPKEERDALIAAEPDKFHLPVAADLRYNWVRVRLDRIDRAELRELIVEAWRMVVPKRVAADFDAASG
jgi:hypothetical protein